MPNFLRSPRTHAWSATKAPRTAPVLRIVATATAATFLLSGCGVAQDIAEEFGNARQVSEEPETASPGGGVAPEQNTTASSTPSADPLPSYAETTVVGDYAPGFPPDLLPMPQGAELLATSAEPVAGSKPPAVQVTLNLSAKQGPGKLMDQIAEILDKRDFESVPAPDKNGMDEQLAFTRSTTVKDSKVNESLLVGILRSDKQSLLTLSGTVAVPSDDQKEKK